MLPASIIIIVAACSSLMIIAARIQQKTRSLAVRAKLIERLTEQGISSAVAGYILQGNRLKAVKAYREESGLGLREATVYIDEVSRI